MGEVEGERSDRDRAPLDRVEIGAGRNRLILARAAFTIMSGGRHDGLVRDFASKIGRGTK